MHIYETTNTNCVSNCAKKYHFWGEKAKKLIFEVNFAQRRKLFLANRSTSTTIENTGKEHKKSPTSLWGFWLPELDSNQRPID